MCGHLHDVSVRSLGGLMLSPASTAPLYLTPTFAARTAKPATEHWRRRLGLETRALPSHAAFFVLTLKFFFHSYLIFQCI